MATTKWTTPLAESTATEVTRLTSLGYDKDNIKAKQTIAAIFSFPNRNEQMALAPLLRAIRDGEELPDITTLEVPEFEKRLFLVLRQTPLIMYVKFIGREAGTFLARATGFTVEKLGYNIRGRRFHPSGITEAEILKQFQQYTDNPDFNPDDPAMKLGKLVAFSASCFVAGRPDIAVAAFNQAESIVGRAVTAEEIAIARGSLQHAYLTAWKLESQQPMTEDKNLLLFNKHAQFFSATN